MSIFTVAYHSKDVKQTNAIISNKIDHSKVSITCFFDKIMYEYVGQNNDL